MHAHLGRESHSLMPLKCALRCASLVVQLPTAGVLHSKACMQAHLGRKSHRLMPLKPALRTAGSAEADGCRTAYRDPAYLGCRRPEARAVPTQAASSWPAAMQTSLHAATPGTRKPQADAPEAGAAHWW